MIKKIAFLIISLAIGIMLGWHFYKNNSGNLDTVQKRTMFTLGLLWGNDDTTICKTKNYTVSVKIAGEYPNKGTTYPIVSINGSSFIKSHAYGDFLLDRQEFVFYHDSTNSNQPTFTVRFNWISPNANQKQKAQCYFEINKNKNDDAASEYEYGTIIVKHPDK